MIDITLYFTFLASTSLLLLCPSSSFVVRPASGHAEKLKVAASSSVGGSSGITQIKARGQEDDHAAPAAGFGKGLGDSFSKELKDALDEEFEKAALKLATSASE